MACYANTSCSSYPNVGVAPETFSSALKFFAAAQCLITPEPLPEPEANVCDYGEFDFIIIGAGTAGCVVANRLTENENVSVLLIEAGGDAPVESRIPNFLLQVFNSEYDWKYLTANDNRTSQASHNGSILWPRGKMFGGSTNINGMFHVKGRRHDYQQWYDDGNEDWHPDVVDSFFKKAENLQNQNLLQNSQINAEYGQSGNLIVNRFNSTIRQILQKIVVSWEELGISSVNDTNLPDKFGAGITTVAATNGLRQSSEIAYVYPILNRPNLKILKNTFVRKILLDKFNKAYGVEVERKECNIYARLEVILSAGAISSPHLLLLSGIGPQKQLEGKNISCQVNSSEVGQNLQDHVGIPITIYADGPNKPSAAIENFDAIKYLFNRTGYLAQGSISDTMAFYSRSKNVSFPEYQNHFSLFWKNSSSSVSNWFSDICRYKEPILSSILELNKNHTLFLFLFNLLHPFSSGNISLNTNDPEDYPLIYPNYFLNSTDLDSTVSGIKMVTKIVNTTYFKSYNAFLGRMNWTECDLFELDSDNYWRCVSINMVQTLYHPVGTCKMGPDPKTSVVDSHLRVHGVKNLRVIDASIMPTITSGNTCAPTYMIAERGVDLLKKDLNL